MATSLSKLFEPAQLTASLVSYYTLSEGSTTILDNLVIRLVNTTGSAETVEGNLVPSGDSAGDDNKIVSAATVPANDYILVTVPTMKNGDFLQLSAGSATTITVHHESGLPKSP